MHYAQPDIAHPVPHCRIDTKLLGILLYEEMFYNEAIYGNVVGTRRFL